MKKFSPELHRPATPAEAKHTHAVLKWLVFLLACTVPVAAAFAMEGGVYVSDEGISVDQAFGDALAEKPRKPGEHFWVVISGAQVARVTKKDANQDVLAWVQRVRERGGIVYVCRSDLARHGIEEDELLDGVAQVYGYGEKDWAGLPAKKESIVLPENIKQSQRILKTCASENEAGS